MIADRSILFMQTAFLGDLLLSIPTLKRLRQKFPEHKMVLYCRKGLGSLLEQLKVVDEFVEMDKKDQLGRLQAYKKFSDRKFELLICPHQSVSSMILAKQIRARTKIGYAKWWNQWIFDQVITRPMPLPEAIRQLALLSPIDSEIKRLVKQYHNQFSEAALNLSQIRDAQHPGWVPEWASMSLTKEVGAYNSSDKKEPRVLIAPGSVWGTKRWTLEGYIEVAKHYAKTHSIGIVGAPNESPLAEQIIQEVPMAKNFCGLRLMDSLVLMQNSELLVTNDCGAMHLASVVELPTVSAFGPTVLAFGYRPWQNQALVIENHKIACRPCSPHGPQKCPLGTHECMRSISARDMIKMTENF